MPGTIEITNINEAAYLMTRGGVIEYSEIDRDGFVKFYFRDAKKIQQYLADLFVNKATVKAKSFIENLMYVKREITKKKRGNR